MTIEKYTAKIKTLVIQKMLIEEKMTDLENKRKEEIENGNYNGPATTLYFILFDEKFAICRELGKIEDKMKAEGFDYQKYCDLHNRYIDIYKNI